MAAPPDLVKHDKLGYYWAQIYIEDTEELTPPMIVQIFYNDGRRQASWLGCEQTLVIPKKWVWLAYLEPPEPLTAVFPP